MERLPPILEACLTSNSSQWIIGNTFPFVVFGSFGAFWLTFGFTQVPFYNAAGAFVTETYTTGIDNPEFNASFGKLYLPFDKHKV